MFQNIFNRNEDENSEVDRILLTEEGQLKELLDASVQKPVLLFKHSTSCGISAMVLKRLENKLNKKNEDYYFYFLDLIRYRSISNLIADEFNIPHQSPQLIILKNGKVVDYSSHYGIIEIEL